MEALLPSEVSRLVLGYLEEQSCTAAYQTFLETCPHLKECAEAALLGCRFSTRAAGRSLREILNEYCLIYTIVQDRIQKLPESTVSQLKVIGISLADQVKQLIDGKQTGQTFHVNINLPTQPKTSKPRMVGSRLTHIHHPHPSLSHHMVTPTSSRMRRSTHPIQEQRLTLRPQDLKEDVTASVTVQRVETTQLESLPGSTVNTSLSVSQPIRKSTHSGNRSHLESSENAHCDEVEEENASLLDPKTGELSSPVHQLCQASDPIGSLKSVTRTTDSQYSSVKNAVESNSSVQSTMTKRQNEEPSGSGRTADQSVGDVTGALNENTCGRSSLDRLLLNIMSTHSVHDNAVFHEKSVNDVSCPTELIQDRTDGSFILPPSGCGLKEQAGNQTVSLTHGISLQEQVRNEVSSQTSPNQKSTQKSVHEAYLNTPRRSAAKRKTKPTPLKMMTPLKHKTGSDSSDSADVIIDPKLFYGPLLDKRELHERIAENINQFIRPYGAEEGGETSEMNTPEVVNSTVDTSGNDGRCQISKDSSTQEELEKVIKTVVDKTESDPLFESLLCDILGPECDDDEIIVETLSEGKSADGGEGGSNITRPSEDGNKDPIALLEDQNEAAIKSILEAQPMMKDSPNPKQGKTVVKRKGKRVSRNSRAKVVKGRKPSGAFLPIFGELEISGKSIGREDAGVSAAAATNENVQANGQDGNKLIILPLQDIVAPMLTYPTIIFNGVPHCMVASTQGKLKAIAPKETMNIIPGNPPFILRKVNPEDVKNLNLNSSTSIAADTDPQITFTSTNSESSVNAVVIQENMSFSDHITSAVHSIDLTGHVDGLQNVDCSDTSVNIEVHTSKVTLDTRNTSDKSATRKEKGMPVVGGESCGQGLTPDVVNTRPKRAATEGRLKNLNKEEDTPLMPSGNHRVSMSTPRRKSRGHVRALDFGSTPPKQSPASDASSKVLTTSTPDDILNKLGGGLNNAQTRQRTSPKAVKKALTKCLGPGSNLPDLSTTCIATRSPPPRLSGAWNKMGVDLIFGCDSSPINSTSPPSQGGKERPPADATKVCQEEGPRDGAMGSLTWETPKAKAKGTWDGALRAQLGDTQGAPRITRDQRRAMLRMEKMKKKTEAQAAAEEARNQAMEQQQQDLNKSLKQSKGKGGNKSGVQDVEGKSGAEVKNQRKSVDELEKSSGQEKQNLTSDEHTSVVKDSKKSVSGEEEFDAVGRSMADTGSQDEDTGEQVTVGEKRKRNSTGDTGAPKKKAVTAQPRPAPETETPHAKLGEPSVSPEKTWVVQQSPGSWANKRSLHGSGRNQNVTDSDGGKLPLTVGAARRCIDLQETPRKPEPADNNERGTQLSGLAVKQSSTCDRSALTVVDTPLFPPTPGISGSCTPLGQDSNEIPETFPTYFKPREKEDSIRKEKPVESVTSANVKNGAASQSSLQRVSVGSDEDVVTESVGRNEEDIERGGDESNNEEFDDFMVENTSTKAKKKARARKSAVKKTAAPKTKAADRQKKSKAKGEEKEDGNAAENDSEDEEVLPTRVLRPRKKTNYTDVTVEESKKDDESNEVKDGGKKKAAPRKRKKVGPEPVPDLCDIIAEEDIGEGLVYKPLAPEVVSSQKQEAEVLAKQISLKLSPLKSKISDLEEQEEEDEAESNLNVSSPTGKTYKSVERHLDGSIDSVCCLTRESNSIASSHSNSSDSSSSESSSEDEGEPVRPATPEASAGGLSCDSGGKTSKDDVSEKEQGEKGVEVEELTKSSQADKQEVTKQAVSTSVGENVENHDVEKRSSSQEKKGSSIREEDKVLALRGRSEVENVSRTTNLFTPQKDDPSKRLSLSSDQKRRRDYLEKILFGRDDDSEDVARSSETGAAGSLVTSLGSSSHSFSTELEMKKQRTMERLKGGKTIQNSVALGQVEVRAPESPAQSNNAALTLESSGSDLNSSQEKSVSDKVNSKVTPMKTPRKSTPVKETDKITNIFFEDSDCDDCPTLRLSEAEDSEFVTPDKMLISPGKFDLLASVEDKVALLHGDTTSPIMKKTARMSCMPAVLRSSESSPLKEQSKKPGPEATFVSNTLDVSPKETGKESSTRKDLEAIPSTSRAAELRHKAEERKYLNKLNALPAPSKTSGVTLRKNNKEKPRRSLRSKQAEVVKEDAVRNEESSPSDQPSVLNNGSRSATENCNNAVKSGGKHKSRSSCPKKSKEGGKSKNSSGENVIFNSEKSKKGLTKLSERQGGVSESRNEVGKSKPASKVCTEKESADNQSSAKEPLQQENGAGALAVDGGKTKPEKKQQKKSLDGTTEGERSKDKPARSRKKSSHSQESTSKEGMEWVLSLNEDDLTRDGFTAGESGERSSEHPPTIGRFEASSQKVLDAIKSDTQKGTDEIEKSKDATSANPGEDTREKDLQQTNCDSVKEMSSGKDLPVDQEWTSPLKTTRQKDSEVSSVLNVEKVREQLLADVWKQLKCAPKETSRKSSKSNSKSVQKRPSDMDEENESAPLNSVAVGDGISAPRAENIQEGTTTEKSEKTQRNDIPTSKTGNDSLENISKGNQSYENVTHESLTSSNESSPTTTDRDPTTSVSKDNSINADNTICSQVPAAESANNSGWSLPAEVSFSSNEVYVSLVYDEDNPPATSSVLASELGPPLSPSAPELEGLTVELDGEIVTITKSDYIELFSYTPNENTAVVDDGVQSQQVVVPATISKKSKTDNEKQKVVAKKKNDEDLEQKSGAKGSAASSDRKRKHGDDSEPVKDVAVGKSLRTLRKKERALPKKSLTGGKAVTDKEMESIERVVEACNDVSNDENTVDDDSLMTYAIIGSVGCEESHNKGDEGPKKFLPLKKRRTTTEDTPVKSQAEGDVVNNNPGMFFQLNRMEIEDFLSKVHGDGS